MAGDGSEKLIDEKGKRLDGRDKNGIRPTSVKIGVLKNADGSAEIRQGKNIIVAAVYGPRELHPKHRALPDKALIQCFYRMSTFSVNERKSPAPSRREREISKIISDSLESLVLTSRYPRTTIDVYIQILQADGGTRCASLTAASVALADAGIPMRGLVSGLAAGIVNDQVVLDLCDIEDQKGSGDMPIGYAPATDEISLLQLDGVFSIKQFEEALNLGIEGCKQVYELQQEALKTKYSSIRDDIAPEDDEEDTEDDQKNFLLDTLEEESGEEETEPYATGKKEEDDLLLVYNGDDEDNDDDESEENITDDSDEEYDEIQDTNEIDSLNTEDDMKTEEIKEDEEVLSTVDGDTKPISIDDVLKEVETKLQDTADENQNDKENGE